jgi:hypothetical protein
MPTTPSTPSGRHRTDEQKKKTPHMALTSGPHHSRGEGHGSIAVVERFILSLKDEALRRILVPLRMPDMRLELARYALWYNEHQPHASHGGATPSDLLRNERPAIRMARLEPRARYPVTAATAAPQTRARGKPGVGLKLVASYHDGAVHLPIVEIRKSA